MIDLANATALLAELVNAAAAEQIPDVIGALESAKARALAKLMPSPVAGPPRLVDAAEMADLIGVPEGWVRDKARAGALPCRQLGHYVRFDAAEVLEAVRKMPAPQNRGFCSPKKGEEKRGGSRRVSKPCPNPPAAEVPS